MTVRQAVLALITESDSALSQDAIEERITVKINRATIYRILNQFCEDGILCRIVTGNGKQYFALRDKKDNQTINDFHFHFRCTKCQQVECLPWAINFSAPKGYVLKDANCVFSGICGECAGGEEQSQAYRTLRAGAHAGSREG